MYVSKVRLCFHTFHVIDNIIYRLAVDRQPIRFPLRHRSVTGSDTFPLPPCPFELWVPEPEKRQQQPALYLGPVTCLERRHEADACHASISCVISGKIMKNIVLKVIECLGFMNMPLPFAHLCPYFSITFRCSIRCSVILTVLFSHHAQALQCFKIGLSAGSLLC